MLKEMPPCGVPYGEELGHDRLRRDPVALEADLLHHAPDDESTHRVGHDEHLVRAGLGADGHDQVVEAGRRRLYVKAVGRDAFVQGR